VENAPQESSFYIIANNLAIDLVNTVTSELNGEGLATWAKAVGLFGEKPNGNWREKSVADAIRFRDKLREIVITLVETKDISDADIEWINKTLGRKTGHSELVRTAEGFAKQSRIELTEPKDIAVPVIESFVDLVAFGNIDYIRKCERPECLLYFYDTTKNHKRRWCSMAVCGNRAKVAKFYERQRSKR
jgi:predicted RNA-binding Zn ribbon-like protein